MFSVSCLRLRQIVPVVSQTVRKKSLYNRSLQYFFTKNLLITNSVSSGIFMLFGDLIQQEIEYRRGLLDRRYDWARSARMCIVGTALGPMHHYYYLYLDKFIPKATFLTAMQKIFFDQLFASPGTIILFFLGIGYLEGKNTYKVGSELREKFVYVYLGDCIFWPPVQFINFYFLPSRYRVFYINFATMIFNVFLSYMKHDFKEK
ncbi:unnamed protein product [Plutella xylostella]|uniref:(diamondback moth) hypothetical protein n=1 Tax=Plutella xylostella TaxID=51655 RepID=A0A8S4EJH2_PLUXY|nr:unnamed protein product [Plutella xylostella]